MSYKEELSIALIEATLSLADQYSTLTKAYSNVCLEVGEITSKVLDWKTISLHKSNPMLAEFVTTKYFHFIELIASNHIMSAGTNERLQHLLYEVFKRLLNSRAQSQAADEQRVLTNIELPVAQAQACLLLSRHMNPL